MITEDYISFELAKLLKEKGFDEVCRTWYFGEDRINNSTLIPKDELLFVSDNYYGAKRNSWIGYPNAVTAPTVQMVIKWLQKIYKIIIIVSPSVTDDDGDAGCLWEYTIQNRLEIKYRSECLFEKTKDAYESAIKYYLENNNF